ncbi:uncharacterized protein LOC111824595 [Myotis lucifugus]|uniref:uncharacterized protein LOC111824595 n=1 Tax=Myotis lucifugus TaxID=59463 RepID=UPI000CCBE056|nr:uncharacterized protein LOC111824595 [Myotis lucifugus]
MRNMPCFSFSECCQGMPSLSRASTSTLEPWGQRKGRVSCRGRTTRSRPATTATAGHPAVCRATHTALTARGLSGQARMPYSWDTTVPCGYTPGSSVAFAALTGEVLGGHAWGETWPPRAQPALNGPRQEAAVREPLQHHQTQTHRTRLSGRDSAPHPVPAVQLPVIRAGAEHPHCPGASCGASAHTAPALPGQREPGPRGVTPTGRVRSGQSYRRHHGTERHHVRGHTAGTTERHLPRHLPAEDPFPTRKPEFPQPHTHRKER